MNRRIPNLSRVFQAGAYGRPNSASTFTPLDLSSLSFWVRPDVGVYKDAGTDPAEDTDPVYQQNDQSANARTCVQTTLNARPILTLGGDGKYYLAYDGGNDEMALSSLLTIGANADGWCVYCVCSRTSNANFITPLGRTVTDHCFILFGTTAYLVVGGVNVSVASVNGSGLMLLKWSRAAAPSGGLVTFQATGKAATSMGWSGTDVGTIAVNMLGSRPPQSAHSTDGSLSHVIVTNTDISGTADETALLAYLASETGATF